ncbi:MAG: LEA type 2 family protein, partial [Bacteroidia bacterium]|nr:LEA type 2 family protein [Bacteroidia bacterium]
LNNLYENMKQIISFFLILSLTSCISLKPVEFRGVENVKLEKLSGKTVRLITQIKISNQNNFGFYLKNVDLSVVINDKDIAMINVQPKMQINPRSDDVYDIPVEVNLEEVLKSGGTVIKLITKKDVDLRLKGQLKVGKFFFSRKLSFDVEKKISSKELL